MKPRSIPLLYEQSAPGRVGVLPPESDLPPRSPPAGLERSALPLPELDEATVVRHFTRLSQLNFSVDGQFYPLGSCTMKYNPKMNDAAAAFAGFRRAHPLAPESLNQGALGLMFGLQESLQAVTGFPAVSLQPAAGAQAEFAALLMFRAYFADRGEGRRVRMLVPDSAHGTNPASCAMAGFTVETLASDASGGIDLAALRAACAPERAADLAGIMVTNPSTLGLFERNIDEVAAVVHAAGGLVYGDGANLNALVGVLKPAELGFDAMHANLHKTFATPHGGGGPGAGALGAAAGLAAYLPGPLAAKSSEGYGLVVPGRSIGRVKSGYGNFGVLVRAAAYLRRLGADGLRRAAEHAVLNANYLRSLVEADYPAAYGAGRRSMHEFVVTARIAGAGEEVRAVDVAKRLIDLGFHPPTMYFPLIVKEALMIEPTETESRETLDAFAAAMAAIAAEARTDPAALAAAPTEAPIGRPDELAAARQPILRYGGVEPW